MAGLARLLIVLATALVFAEWWPEVAVAAGPPGSHYRLDGNKGGTSYTATISTSGRGVWIDVHARQTYAGQYTVPSDSSGSYAAYEINRGSPYSQAGSGVGATAAVGRSWTNAQGEPYYQVGGHTYHLEGLNIGIASSGPTGWFTTGSRAHPGEVPVGLIVDGKVQGIIWVPFGNLHLGMAPTPGAAAGRANAGSAPVVVDPRVVALDVLRHIPLPNVQIRMNPQLGLVAMPGWFWAEGYNGAPFGGSATVGAYTVSVQVQPSSYTWSFGDGATLVSHDLGQPYPAESDIQHTYQYSSLHYSDGFPLRLTIQFTASYSVNGGPAEPLSAMERTYTAGYRVQELQSILTNR